MANPFHHIAAAMSHLKALHPAMFGSYGDNNVNMASISPQIPHIGNVTFGVGAQGVPLPPSMPDHITHPMGYGQQGQMAPGFSVRIGGSPDVTDPRFRAVAGRMARLRDLLGR
ncbi:MAG: hypothetical protein ACRD3D_01035 [Terriglobia bacterium]